MSHLAAWRLSAGERATYMICVGSAACCFSAGEGAENDRHSLNITFSAARVRCVFVGIHDHGSTPRWLVIGEVLLSASTCFQLYPSGLVQRVGFHGCEQKVGAHVIFGPACSYSVGKGGIFHPTPFGFVRMCCRSFGNHHIPYAIWSPEVLGWPHACELRNRRPQVAGVLAPPGRGRTGTRFVVVAVWPPRLAGMATTS